MRDGFLEVNRSWRRRSVYLGVGQAVRSQRLDQKGRSVRHTWGRWGCLLAWHCEHICQYQVGSKRREHWEQYLPGLGCIRCELVNGEHVRWRQWRRTRIENLTETYYHRATFSKLTTFSKFLPATSILRIFPYFKLWYFFSCFSRHMRDFFDILYVKTIVYNTEHWLQNAWLAYYWTSQTFLATHAFPNFIIYLNAVWYVKSQISEYSETIRMSTRKYKF